jgi:hypothetical protein
MATKPQTPTSTEDALKSALIGFETSVATPVVSGELMPWLDSVRATWATLSHHLVDDRDHNHPAQFEQIGSADPELLPRVEQLQEEDAAIEEDRQMLDQAISRSTAHIPKMEPDEEKAEQHIKKLIDQGMAFVARVRKQEVAIQTWFIEAFNRDRGAVD